VPFWSSRERVTEFLSSHEKLGYLSEWEIPWAIFLHAWVGTMVPRGSEVGINWAILEPECWATIEEVVSGVQGAT
jgi:hypothetical protein